MTRSSEPRAFCRHVRARPRSTFAIPCVCRDEDRGALDGPSTGFPVGGVEEPAWVARIRESNGAAATEVLEELKCTHALYEPCSPSSCKVLAILGLGPNNWESVAEQEITHRARRIKSFTHHDKIHKNFHLNDELKDSMRGLFDLTMRAENVLTDPARRRQWRLDMDDRDPYGRRKTSSP